jgi:hypothetical protein
VKSSIKILSLLVATILISACGGSSGSPKGSGAAQNYDANSYEKYTLTQDNRDDLAYMGNEERLAYDVYKYLYEYHDSTIRELYNIYSRSESQHIAIVRDLVNKYNITSNDLTNLTSSPVASNSTEQSSLPSGKYDIGAIQKLYNALIAKGKNSVKDALEVGCMVEVTDINDLNEKITHAEASGAQDIIDAFNILREGSYNHYWAFDSGLKNNGISEGCCSLGDEYCHPEYPKR